MKRDRTELERLLSASVATTTKKKYDGLWTRWCSYADSHLMRSRPARGCDVALFLANLAQKKDKTVCAAAAAAITWHHSSNGLPSPCSEPIVKTALAGAKRLLGAPVKRTEAISIKLLRQLVTRLPTSSEPPDLQFYFYVIVAFFGFFRFSDMKRLRIQDFTKRGANLLVTLPSSKTDKFRAGALVYLSANSKESTLCPATITSTYFSRLSTAGYQPSSTILPSFAKRGAIVSMATLTKRLRAELSPFVDNADSYTLHSFRSGGATAAANAKVPRSLIATHMVVGSRTASPSIDISSWTTKPDSRCPKLWRLAE